jgi:regulator of replication initiation timing
MTAQEIIVDMTARLADKMKELAVAKHDMSLLADENTRLQEENDSLKLMVIRMMQEGKS